MPDDEENSGRLTSGPADIHGSSSQGAANARAKRSRRPGLVTSNACTECRKKRAKVPFVLRKLPAACCCLLLQCDGNNPCARCNEHGIAHCAYETPSRQSKDSLRQEIDELRRQLDQKNTVLSALVNPSRPRKCSLGRVVARVLTGCQTSLIIHWARRRVMRFRLSTQLPL